MVFVGCLDGLLLFTLLVWWGGLLWLCCKLYWCYGSLVGGWMVLFTFEVDVLFGFTSCWFVRFVAMR